VVRLSEAAASLDVARSTAHRLLAMLQFHGFVRQDPDTRAYVAGPGLWDFGPAAVSEMEVRTSLRPYLTALSAALGETAHACVLRGTSVVFVDSVESVRMLRAGARIGVSLPAHCTSAGKAMLARMPLEAVALLYPQERLPGLTVGSLTRFSTLADELAVVRSRGWATNVGESESDIAAVAVAVDGLGPRAALAVSAPRERMSARRRDECGRVLLAAARRATSSFAPEAGGEHGEPTA
jgi:IclR family acetate operon transcriptional repressor